MTKIAISPCVAAIAILLGGCASLETSGTGNATTLQTAIDADHKTAISLLNKANAEDLPYRIEAEAGATAFSRDRLNLLAPEDIASWDKILTALDSYCAALSQLESGTRSTDFQTAAESLGSGIQSLAKTANLSDSHGSEVATAVTELGSIIIRYKAESEARTIAKAADPAFQTIIGDLISALGFEGHPPAESAHGILATYEADFAANNAEDAKSFKGGTIAGFAEMGPAQKRVNIREFVAWQATDQDHDDFVAAVKALVAALDKAAAAHAALAQGSKETVANAFDQLKTEIQNVKAIYQKFPKG